MQNSSNTMTADAGDSRPQTIHTHEIRKLLGNIPERTFAKLLSEGIITPAVRGSGRRPSEFVPFAAVQQYIAYLRSQGSGDDRHARARRDAAQAEMTELRLKVQRRELLPRDQVVREGRSFIVAARAKLLTIPYRLVSAGLVPANAQPKVEELLYEALEEMSRWRKQADLLADAKAP
jgi:hypothetical protein